MVRMVVTAEHQYAGRRLHPGDEYKCEPQHVEPFEKLGWARRKEEERAAGEYLTRDMSAGVRRARRLTK